jgi:AraC-like DNA-binding protein
LKEEDTYREWEAPPEWRHAVDCCWEQRVVVADRHQRVVPDGHADLLLHDSGVIEIVGLADHVAVPLLARGTRIRGIRLRPEAVAAALATNASELVNLTVDAEDVLGARRVRELVDDRALDAWLRSIQPDGRTTNAVRLLATHPVTDTADELGISVRHLRRVLTTTIGLTPKAFQRVLRLQRFLASAERSRTGLAAAAADAGYADQPHLTREVVALTGTTPARLLEERRQPT